MSIECCHHCVPPKRHTACHATCIDYIIEKAIEDAKKEEERERRNLSNAIYSQRGDAVRKANKRHGKK